MSTPNPGDVLPLWNPDIPGEEIQAGRLGIRVRPGTPAAAKVLAMEAAGGAELLRQVLEDQRIIDGIYTIVKPEKPLEFTGQVSTTLLTGKLGRTPMGLALEITDWQDLDGEYEMEKNRLRLRYQELHVVKEWDGDLEGFTAIQLREQAKTLPILDSTMRFIEHLRDYREKLAEAAVRRYEATEQWMECPKCEAEVPTSNGIHCPECGEDMRGGEYVRAVLHLVDDAEGRIYRGIDSLTVRSAGFPEYRGMSLDRIQGSNLWVSFRRYDPLPDEGIVLPTASVEMFEAQRSVIRQLQIGSPRTGAMAAELGDTGWLGSPPRVPLDGKKAHHLPDPNEEQAEAVARVMGMRPGQMYLIQGPPGTGKTTAIVESIRRILGRNPNASILMSSHSNDAVDTGQERLLGFSHVRQARIAEPGKVPRRLRPTLVESDDLEPYNLVAGTCNRLAIDSRLRFKVFDWLILDEANKVRANEALALMPLAKRWVMIGDLKQLPPVMEEAASTFKVEQPLDELVRDDSFYGWIWDKVPASSKIMLPRQYRMREPIGRVVSDLFYEGKLIHEAPHPRMPLPWPFDRELVWVDTGSAGRVPRRSAIGRQRVRGGPVQGHHLDHPAPGPQGQARRDRDVRLAGQPVVLCAQGHRAARRHRVGRRVRRPRVGRRHPVPRPVERPGGDRLPQRPEPGQRGHLARQEAARHRRRLQDRDRRRTRALRAAVRALQGGGPGGGRRSGGHGLPASGNSLPGAAAVAPPPRRSPDPPAPPGTAPGRRCRQRRGRCGRKRIRAGARAAGG